MAREYFAHWWRSSGVLGLHLCFWCLSSHFMYVVTHLHSPYLTLPKRWAGSGWVSWDRVKSDDSPLKENTWSLDISLAGPHWAHNWSQLTKDRSRMALIGKGFSPLLCDLQETHSSWGSFSLQWKQKANTMPIEAQDWNSLFYFCYNLLFKASHEASSNSR
jgi:hypothetical protein